MVITDHMKLIYSLCY